MSKVPIDVLIDDPCAEEEQDDKGAGIDGKSDQVVGRPTVEEVLRAQRVRTAYLKAR